MALDVLQPVERRRRRRRRYRRGRLVPLVVVVLLGVGLGIYVGWRGTRGSHPAHAALGAGARSKPAAAPQSAAHAVQPLHLLHGTPLLAGRPHRRIVAPAAILVDAHTGRVLWAKHPHRRRPIASLTKIMTAVLALREVPWHRVITVDRRVTRVPLLREGLRTGEHVPAWKLFYALLLYSGNDDAAQLAISVAGSVHRFLRRMNDEARRLGLRDTHFRSPSGVIDKGNYSTPWDLAALTRYARRDRRFRRLVRTKQIEVPWAPPTNSKIYVNNNWLLREYRGANGVKTGYTRASGWCLAASATRRGRTLIAVVLDSPNMYADAKRLFDLGFSES